jgi:hypothetical protein
MSRFMKLASALIVSLALLVPAGAAIAATKTAHKAVKKSAHKGHRAKGWGRKGHHVASTRHKGHRMTKAHRTPRRPHHAMAMRKKKG